MRLLRWTLLLCTLSVVSAGADQEKTGRKPPHYAGRAPAAAVTMVRGPVLAGRSLLEPGPQPALLTAFESRRTAFEAALDSLSVPVAAALSAAFADGAPFVYVGSPEGFHAPERLGPTNGEVLPRDAIYVRLGDPGGDWRKRARAAAEAAGATHVLVVALELSDYPVSQKNWKGSKAVDLADGHTLALPWLTSLDQPVEVLQWTGVLCRADGRPVRGGAEAFAALRTPFVESAAGLQRTISVETLEQALAAAREDLAGTPPAWRVGLANLVAELAGRPRHEGGAAGP